MAWSEIEAFIRRKDEALLSGARGVPEEDLVVFESSAGVELPRHYRDCLLRIGGSQTTLRPLGPAWTDQFRALVLRPPEPEFLEHGLLRIGLHEDDGAIVDQDIYMDLNRSNDGDAPLVDVETFAEYDPADLEPRGLTFVDQVVRRAFRLCEYDHRPEDVGLIVRPSPDAKDVAVLELVKLLQKLGLEPCLPSSPRMVVLSGNGKSVLIEARESKPFVFVDVAADTRVQAGRVVEVLLDNVDGLRRRAAPKPLSDG